MSERRCKHKFVAVLKEWKIEEKKRNLKVKIPELNEGSESRCHGDTVPAERWWFGFMQMWGKPFLICPDANFPSASAAAMIPLSPGKAAGWLRSDWGREKKSVQIVGLSFHRVQLEISQGEFQRQCIRDVWKQRDYFTVISSAVVWSQCHFF